MTTSARSAMLTASDRLPARPRPSVFIPWSLQPSVVQTFVFGDTMSRMAASGVTVCEGSPE